MPDTMLRGLIDEDHVRLVAVDVTGIAEYTRQLHELQGDAARVAAEAVAASVLLAAQIKGEERIALQIQGSKPKMAFMGDVDANGGLRARFTPEIVRLPYYGRMEGMLLVIKSIPGQEVYRGVTEIDAEPLESALGRHLGQAAQIDVILRIGASVSEDGSIAHAGGLFHERLPTPAEQDLEASADFAVKFDPVRELGMAEILAAVSGDTLMDAAIERLEERSLHWRCSCGQERVEAILVSLGDNELQDILTTDGQAEVICHFCNIRYEVGSERLEQLIELCS